MSTSMKQESANLDLLRSSAVSMVVGFHLYLALGLSNPARFGPLAHFGVLIFFVHTSLVLMMSMDRVGLHGLALFENFYIRRFFRIYPLSIAVVLLVVGLHIPSTGWDPPVFKAVSFPSLISNLALTMNLTGSTPVLSPLWSLPWEVQMYAVLPALFLFFRRHNSLPVLAAAWAATTTVAWGATQVIGRAGFIFQFAPCFLGGIIAFHIKKKIKPVAPAWVFPLGLAVVVAFYLRYPSYGGWVPCLLLAILIPVCRDTESRVVSAVCSRVARYSYGIYLGHTPALWLAFKVIKLPAAFQICFFAIAIVLVPMAMFHFLEAPMIRLGSRLSFRASVRKESTSAIPEASLGVSS
jgi:peptidoglycan/LPS O-acetylase OafA/YrhL